MQNLHAREQAILKYLAQGQGSNINFLSEMLRVSTNTIRNDLKSLEEKNCIITGRGGVVPSYYPELLQRMNLNFDTKLSIAEKVAGLIHNDDTIMISCGTTCSLVGRFLYGMRNINLITHSTLFLSYARTNPNLNLIVVGGEFVPQEDATVGSTTIEELGNYFPRLTIVGSDNFSLESGITTSSMSVASVIRKMLTQATTRVLVVESRKFGEARAVKICSLDEIDVIVSDTNLNNEAAVQLKDMGKELILTELLTKE